MKLKNVVPRFYLKIVKNDGSEEMVTTTKKMKIIAKVRNDPASKRKIKVTYGADVINEGTFTTKEEALQAISAWTEKILIDFIENGEW